MLLLTRRSGQSITIKPYQELDASTPVGVLFSHGPIEIRINRVVAGGVRMGIQAHRQFHILRNELSPETVNCPVESLSRLSSREILARNVFELRVKRNLSALELADESNLALTTIFALEREQGMILLEDLDRLAVALRVNVATLLKA